MKIATFARTVGWSVIATTTTLLLAGGAGLARTTPTTVHVQGLETAWDLALVRIRGMDSIPHFYWKAATHHFYRVFVLTLSLTNRGRRAADPYDDMMLTLKVMPPHFTYYTAGFTSVPKQVPFIAMLHTASREFGGVPPWTMTQPGQSTTYCYIIATNRGDSHYGLYSYVPYKRMDFLLDTGL